MVNGMPMTLIKLAAMLLRSNLTIHHNLWFKWNQSFQWFKGCPLVLLMRANGKMSER